MLSCAKNRNSVIVAMFIRLKAVFVGDRKDAERKKYRQTI